METVETDAVAGTAQNVAAEVLGWIPGVSQGGRLETTLTLSAEDAQKVTRELNECGFKAWSSVDDDEFPPLPEGSIDDREVRRAATELEQSLLDPTDELLSERGRANLRLVLAAARRGVDS